MKKNDAAPQSWSPEMRARWLFIPPDVRAYIAQRERDMHKRITSLGDRLAGEGRKPDQTAENQRG